ncbi:MAG TPA: DNA primase, partial [Burkholderiaceae bacterium]|nr:DNA primase [Burkholderiaceae bacterium]
MIPQGFIQDLLARADIVDVVGQVVPLKKAGINYKGLCPFHGEKSPSFVVSPSRQTYHCFGCGAHGNAVGFLMEHGGLGFVEAVRELASDIGVAVPEEDSTPEERARAAQTRERQATLTELLAKAGQHYRQQLKASPRAIDYLKRRGLSGEIAARFGLGYAPAGQHALASCFAQYDDPQLVDAGLVILREDEGQAARRYDRFRDRIMFPIRNPKGEVIGFGGRVIDQGEPKYLNSPETPVFIKGRELYGLYEGRVGIRQRGYVLVTEGYMDVVALAQWGFPNAVATLGTACTADHVAKLLRFSEQVVFSFDGDAAGRRAAGRALEAVLPHASDTRSFRFLFLPAEHDPDSFIREQGTEAFEACVGQAVPLSRQLIAVASEGCDLATPEGRARMLAQARPLMEQLPDGLLREQLLTELAREGGVSPQVLLNHWQGSGRPSARGHAAEPHRAGPALPVHAPTRRPASETGAALPPDLPAPPDWPDEGGAWQPDERWQAETVGAPDWEPQGPSGYGSGPRSGSGYGASPGGGRGPSGGWSGRGGERHGTYGAGSKPWRDWKGGGKGWRGRGGDAPDGPRL